MTLVPGNFTAPLKQITTGSKKYYAWLAFLGFFIAMGLYSYAGQLNRGLIVTAMRDQVSWGFYVSNFTFLVGVAAAAVLLVIPAYIYNFKPIKEMVLFGELLAFSAVSAGLLFMLADLGQPLMFWRILPFIGSMNFPTSLLAWNLIMQIGYLIITAVISLRILCRLSKGSDYALSSIGSLLIPSIIWAIGIQLVTAFIFSGLSARPFWNTAILAPRFLAMSFCSGLAIMLIIFQIIRSVSDVQIENRAVFGVAELIAYAMGLNLLLLGIELFTEFFSGTVHSESIRYLYLGIRDSTELFPLIWLAVLMNIVAFFLLLFPGTRKNFITLNAACVFAAAGIYMEKGIGLVIPGFIPDALGEIYNYSPTSPEIFISVGIWAFGAMIYTLLLKVAIPIYTGKVRFAAGPDTKNSYRQETKVDDK
jgi:Ni/Fe-hydrogenase subunit HybB-like protein